MLESALLFEDQSWVTGERVPKAAGAYLRHRAICARLQALVPAIHKAIPVMAIAMQ